MQNKIFSLFKKIYPHFVLMISRVHNAIFFKFDFMKLGKTKNSINIKAIDGIISSNPII